MTSTGYSGSTNGAALAPASSGAVCVLGMHRSGTSMVTRLLNILGVDLGPPDHLMKWISGNPRGHWEHEGFVNINKEILARLGGSWHDLPTFPQGWEQAPAFADLRRQARELLADDFGGAPLWGWKDPRTCVTAPFWQLVVGEMDYVLCFRNPVDVARSLNVRRNEPLDVQAGAVLWLRYVQASLRHAAGRRTIVVFYEDLMEDWQTEVVRLREFLGPRARGEAQTMDEVVEFVEGGLWHHRASVADVVDDSELSLPVKAVYLALRLAASQGDVNGSDPLELVGTLAEYAVEASNLEASLVDECQRRAEAAAAADREAAQAWELLREHRRSLGRLLGASPMVTGSAARTAYHNLLEGVRAQAARAVPKGATVLVVTKGDSQLLDVPGINAWHLPRNKRGEYAGYHPASGQDAADHVHELRLQGAGYLLIPEPYAWWLEQYGELANYLDEHAILLDDGDACQIYEFKDSGTEGSTS